MVTAPARSAPSPRPQHSLVSADGHAWIWRFSEGFGAWLRDLRTTHGLTLREVAKVLGISFTRLHKLETGGRVRPPSMEVLARAATLFGLPYEQVLARAGFKMEVPDELRDAARCDEAFSALALHPALRPACMDERWAEAFSRLQKAQWIQFAQNLEAHVLGGGARIADLMRAADVEIPKLR